MVVWLLRFNLEKGSKDDKKFKVFLRREAKVRRMISRKNERI
jgi:hypothetical protein